MRKQRERSGGRTQRMLLSIITQVHDRLCFLVPVPLYFQTIKVASGSFEFCHIAAHAFSVNTPALSVPKFYYARRSTTSAYRNEGNQGK